MKRLSPDHVPAALHTAKSASLLAIYLAGQTPGTQPAVALRCAFAVLGYQLAHDAIVGGNDPTVARALELTRRGMAGPVQS